MVFVMTIKDITAIARVEASYGYQYFESYFVIFLQYILICGLIQWGLFNYRETLYSKRKGTSSAQYRFSIGGDNVTSRTCCKKIWRQTVLEDVNLKVNQGVWL